MFNVMNKKWILLGISAVLVLVSIVSMLVRGLNLDVDFAGGTAIYINMAQDFDNNEVMKLVKETAELSNDPTVQKSGDTQQEVVIRTNSLTDEQVAAVRTALTEKYGLNEDSFLSVDSVSPTIGGELARSAITASIVAVLLMLLYISFRFEFLSGVTAIIALAHDVIVTIGCYALFGWSVNSTFVAAILTILGYSINNTIVIFDRIRENERITKKPVHSEIVEKSVWQSATRSFYTTLTTLFPIVLLFIMGVPSIRQFALPLIIGMVIGTYSSLFVSGPLWATMKGDSKKKANA